MNWRILPLGEVDLLVVKTSVESLYVQNHVEGSGNNVDDERSSTCDSLVAPTNPSTPTPVGTGLAVNTLGGTLSPAPMPPEIALQLAFFDAPQEGFYDDSAGFSTSRKF